MCNLINYEEPRIFGIIGFLFRSTVYFRIAPHPKQTLPFQLHYCNENLGCGGGGGNTNQIN